MANDIFQIQMVDRYTGKTAGALAGVVQVCVAGTAHKATLTDPANNFAALANPITMANGNISFAVATGGPGQATPATVDVYGVTAGGRPIVMKGIKPGDPTEIPFSQNERDLVLIIPFAVADCTPGTEKDTSFVLPTGTLVKPSTMVSITTAAGQGSKTISMGLLSTQSGGSATGFVNGVSLTAIAKVLATITGAGATLGALLSVVQGAGAQLVPTPALVGATAINISYTITSAATLAEGFVMIPVQLDSLSLANP